MCPHLGLVLALEEAEHDVLRKQLIISEGVGNVNSLYCLPLERQESTDIRRPLSRFFHRALWKGKLVIKGQLLGNADDITCVR